MNMYSEVICVASLVLHLSLWLAWKFLGGRDVSLIECLGTSLLLERSKYYRFKCFVRRSTKAVFSSLNLGVPTVCLTHNTDAGSRGREREEGEDTGIFSFLARGNLR